MNDALKEQIEHLKKMGIELDISNDTPDYELAALLAQIDSQLAELGAFDDIALDSEEPATLANMSALAIDINIETDEIITALAEASENEDVIFADEGLAILFKELCRRSLAFSVADDDSDPIKLGAILNECLQKHDCNPLLDSELQAIDQQIDRASDNLYEEVDDVWFELCHLLDQRGLSLIQLINKSAIDINGEDALIQLIALPEPVSHKWTNRGFGNYVLLAFSDLFLME